MEGANAVHKLGPDAAGASSSHPAPAPVVRDLGIVGRGSKRITLQAQPASAMPAGRAQDRLEPIFEAGVRPKRSLEALMGGAPMPSMPAPGAMGYADSYFSCMNSTEASLTQSATNG